MKNIPQIIARAYLRRWPTRLRKSQFNVLSRYSWLKGPLEDIKAELFPRGLEETTRNLATEKISSEESYVIHDTKITEILQSEGIRGQHSFYQVETWFGKRGFGDIFEGIDSVARQPVIVKYYQCPSILSHKTEFSIQQQRFLNLQKLCSLENQPQEDLRVNWPIDLVKDSQTDDRYFLVTAHENHGPTIRQWLMQQNSTLTSVKIRSIIGQILQSLMHLHHHSFRLASDQFQVGLNHGNLSLDSVLRIERFGKEFFYLSDLALWEKFYLNSKAYSPSDPMSYWLNQESIQKDLADLAAIGFQLLEDNDDGREKDIVEHQKKIIDKDLFEFLAKLKYRKFHDTSTAWQVWLKLPPLKEDAAVTLSDPEIPSKQKRKANIWHLVAGGTLLSLLVAGGWWWFARSRSGTIASLPCCIDQVERVPEGEFTYAMLKEGGWHRTLGKVNLLGIGNLAISSSIETSHKSFILKSQVSEPIETIEEAIELVKNSQVDFAIIPLTDNVNLPSELGYEIIAYDGLVVFVPFSYDPRRGGIPKELNGQISLEEIKNLYTENISESAPFHSRFFSNNEETVQVLKKSVLAGDEALIKAFNQATHLIEPPTKMYPAEMLRTMLANFEAANQQSIGFAMLSQIMKQCSIYPLAISAASQDAVQPMVMRDGTPISPKTNLCDDKSLYQPNVHAFRRNEYPLAFPIAVVFPRDNSRPSAGQKFAEMMLTIEAQRLLLEANLVPVVDPFELAAADINQLLSYIKTDPGEADSSQPNADRGKVTYEPISGRRLRSANSTKAVLQEVETSREFVLSPAPPSQEAIDFEAIGEAFLPEPPSEPENIDVAEDEVTEDTIGNESQSNSNER